MLPLAHKWYFGVGGLGKKLSFSLEDRTVLKSNFKTVDVYRSGDI